MRSGNRHRRFGGHWLCPGDHRRAHGAGDIQRKSGDRYGKRAELATTEHPNNMPWAPEFSLGSGRGGGAGPPHSSLRLWAVEGQALPPPCPALGFHSLELLRRQRFCVSKQNKKNQYIHKTSSCYPKSKNNIKDARHCTTMTKSQGAAAWGFQWAAEPSGTKRYDDQSQRRQ